MKMVFLTLVWMEELETSLDRALPAPNNATRTAHVCDTQHRFVCPSNDACLCFLEVGIGISPRTENFECCNFQVLLLAKRTCALKLQWTTKLAHIM